MALEPTVAEQTGGMQGGGWAPMSKDTFGAPPLELPDYISGSLLSDVLLAMPELYKDSRRAVTRGGVPFAQCIKPGIDLDPRVAAQMAKEAPRRFESERTPIALLCFLDSVTES